MCCIVPVTLDKADVFFIITTVFLHDISNMFVKIPPGKFKVDGNCFCYT
jgi:hypothetical protein